MISHISLGNSAFSRSRKLKELINTGQITLAGNKRLKIYGLLGCQSGKRMKPQNRVFFATGEEALLKGYRPCKNCMSAG